MDDLLYKCDRNDIRHMKNADKEGTDSQNLEKKPDLKDLKLICNSIANQSRSIKSLLIFFFWFTRILISVSFEA